MGSRSVQGETPTGGGGAFRGEDPSKGPDGGLTGGSGRHVGVGGTSTTADEAGRTQEGPTVAPETPTRERCPDDERPT